MKGIFLAVTLSICSICISHAQLRIALVAGAHQADILEENNLPSFQEIKQNYSQRTGVHVGFIADLPFSPTSKFSFQPGVILYNRGRKYHYRQDSTVVFIVTPRPDSIVNTVYDERHKHHINYIDIPFNVVYRLPLGKKVKFILGGGPFLSFFYNGFEKKQKVLLNVRFTEDNNEDLPVGDGPGKYLILNYGVNALAGFEFGRVFLTANYTRGLNDFYKASDHDGSYTHQTIGGTLGIFLGKPVNMEKKVKDKDKDGILDDADQCPELAGPAVTNGCPDKDADGIADKDDQCPDVPGILARKGCPVPDTDKDGVLDDNDKCPTVAGLSRYDGCPVPDTDKDGINDEEDKCATVAGVARYAGCPIPDTDGDDVNDENDKCPQVAGRKDKDGCPEAEVKKEVVEKVNYAAKKIEFKVGKADLTPGSFAVLDDVAKLLQSNPTVKLLIEGHTSTEGSYESNMKLSQARAEKVKSYLISKGVNDARVTAQGLGPTQPLNSDKTPAEKAKNRRVELKLSN
jgi:OmpA-OmpF porin, OOP family